MGLVSCTKYKEELSKTDVLIFAVKEALSNNKCSYYSGEIINNIEILKCMRNDFSCINVLGIKTNTGYNRVVAKTILNHPENQSVMEGENQAKVEFDVLSFLYPKYEGIYGCSVPRPLALIQQHDTIVIEYIQGSLLIEEYASLGHFASGKKFHELENNYFYLGAWMRFFKKFTAIKEEGPSAISCVISNCEKRLRMIADFESLHWPPKLSEFIRSDLNRLQNKLADRKIMVSGCHPDMGSWNVICNENGITVIDFLGYKYDLYPLDIIKMVTNFDAEEKYINYSTNRVRKLKARFLEGLGPLLPINKEVAELCEILYRICIVMSCLNKREKSWYNRISIQRILKDNIEWLGGSRRRELLWPGPLVG